MEITYTKQTERGYIRRGLLRAYLFVGKDWARFGLVDGLVLLILMIPAILQAPAVYSYSPRLAIMSLIIYVVLIAVIYFLARVAMAVLMLSLAAKKRPVPTTMSIVPGERLKSADMVEFSFPWQQLRRARSFTDMHVLMFESAPGHDLPVLVDRAMLKPEEDEALIAAFPR